MDKRNLVLASRISNTSLRRDINVLRSNLKQVIGASKRNSEIQQKIDGVGEILLQCPDVESFVERACNALKDSFGLTAVTFCLANSYQELMPQLEQRLLPAPTADRLFFLDQEHLSEFFSNHSGPVVRGRLEHGSVHFFGIRELKRIRSEALIPLVYAGRYEGSVNLGSNDPTRYQEGAATDYLRRFAQLTSLALVNLRLSRAVEQCVNNG